MTRAAGMLEAPAKVSVPVTALVDRLRRACAPCMRFAPCVMARTCRVPGIS